MKRVLVISTSPRVRSNSDALADEFIRGAKEAGHVVEKISIRVEGHPSLQKAYEMGKNC